MNMHSWLERKILEVASEPVVVLGRRVTAWGYFAAYPEGTGPEGGRAGSWMAVQCKKQGLRSWKPRLSLLSV
jgi:hypothetical protein